MRYPNFYQGLDKEKIADRVREEGFDPLFISDAPGTLYQPHTHPQTKLLAIVSGGMEVTVAGETYECQPGDKLLIPGHMEHSAKVGPDGCDFFWSEKML